MDVDALETNAFMGAKYANKMSKTPKAGGLASPKAKKSTEDEKDLLKKRSKKKRKRKLPKNYNPNVEPDPERWLPKRERQGYRRPRKDRRKGE